MKPFSHRPPPQRVVVGLIVLGLAVMVLQVLSRVEGVYSGRSQKLTSRRGDCVYQVFIDDMPLGVACADQPTSITALLDILGEKSANRWVNHSDPVRCNRIIRLSTKTLSASDEKLPGRVLLLAGKRIDINTADAENLSAVPGLGRSLARKVVRFRDSYGPFPRIEDLARVPGIGTEKIRRLEAYLKVGSSVGADELQNVHANRSLFEPTRRIDEHEMPNSSQVSH